MKKLIITLLVFFVMSPANSAFRNDAALMLMMDNSLSMRSSDPHGFRFDAVDTLLKRDMAFRMLGSGIFNGEVRILRPIRCVNDSMKSVIRSELRKKGSELGYYTDTHKALEEGLSLFRTMEDSATVRVLLLLSDGRINVRQGQDAETLKTEDVRTRLLPAFTRKDIHIFTVALGPETDTLLLHDLARESGGGFYYVPSDSELVSSFKVVANDIRSHFLDIQARQSILDARNIALYQGPNAARSFLISRAASIPSPLLKAEIEKYGAADAPHSIMEPVLGGGFLLLLLLYLRALSRMRMMRLELSALKLELTSLEAENLAPLPTPELPHTGPVIVEAAAKSSHTDHKHSENIEAEPPHPLTVSLDDRDGKEEESFVRSTDLSPEDWIPREPGQKPEDPDSTDNLMDEAPLEDTCRIHPGREAVVRCSRCGYAYCSHCSSGEEGDGFICVECQSKEDTRRMLGIV